MQLCRLCDRQRFIVQLLYGFHNKGENVMHYTTQTEYNAGGFFVDLITLPNGQVIGIDEETAVLYQSIEDFHAGAQGTPIAQFN